MEKNANHAIKCAKNAVAHQLMIAFHAAMATLLLVGKEIWAASSVMLPAQNVIQLIIALIALKDTF